MINHCKSHRELVRAGITFSMRRLLVAAGRSLSLIWTSTSSPTSVFRFFRFSGVLAETVETSTGRKFWARGNEDIGSMDVKDGAALAELVAVRRSGEKSGTLVQVRLGGIAGRFAELSDFCDRMREGRRDFGEESSSSTISSSWNVNLSRGLPSSCAFLMFSIDEKRSLIFIRTGSRDLRPGKFVSVSVRTFSRRSGSFSISHAGDEGINDRSAGNEDSAACIRLPQDLGFWYVLQAISMYSFNMQRALAGLILSKSTDGRSG